MGLCDNCALKYADCKGNKDLEKCHCDYYKKPIVMNVKELAERVAELELENKRLHNMVNCLMRFKNRHWWDGLIRCNDCHWWNSETNGCKRNPSVEAWHDDDFCSYGERKK